jgi:hypothetical protein
MRLPRAAVAAAAAVSTLTVLLAPTPRTYAAESGDTVVLPVRNAVQALSVQGEDRTGPHWIRTYEVSALGRCRPGRLSHPQRGLAGGSRHCPRPGCQLRSHGRFLVLQGCPLGPSSTCA